MRLSWRGDQGPGHPREPSLAEGGGGEHAKGGEMNNEEIRVTLEEPLELTGETIRALRKRAELTQAELGAKVGISERSIRAWENREAKPQGHERIRLLTMALAPEKAIPEEQVPVVFEDIPAIRADIYRLLALAPLIGGDINKPVVMEMDDLLLGILSTLKLWEQGGEFLRDVGILYYQRMDGTPVVWLVTEKRKRSSDPI